METKNALTALAALAQETRLAVFRLLVETGPEGLPVGKIGERLGIAPATLSFHLKELGNADLVAYLTDNCCGGNAPAYVPVCVPVPRQSQRKKSS